MPSPDRRSASGDGSRAAPVHPGVKPGDEAPAGTPGTGESVCRRCGGSGKLGTATCPDCRGAGVVTAIVGGA